MSGFSLVAFMSILILLNIFFVLWFGGVDIYLLIVKYYRRLMRYFDPDFMKNSFTEPVLAGNLPEVFEPFNALDVEVNDDIELNLSKIKEAESKDEQSD